MKEVANNNNTTTTSSVMFSSSGPFAKHVNACRAKVAAADLAKFAKPDNDREILELVKKLPTSVEVGGFTSIKDKENAMASKERGNECFKTRQYGEAYLRYTEALQYYPVDESKPTDPCNKDYAIIWANRSAALDSAGLYAAALHDIQQALNYGYPKEFWYKLYKRKGHCAVKMKQYLVAREALETALKNVGKSDIKKEKDRDNYRMKIRKQMTIFNVTKTLYNVEFCDFSPSTPAGCKEKELGLSPKLSVIDGRLVAKETVEPEDVVLALEPFASVVNFSGGRAGGKICPQTMGKMFHPVPCSYGSKEIFSSYEARDKSNASFHQYEYAIMHNLRKAELRELAFLALRMVTLLNPATVSQVLESVRTKKSAESELKPAVEAFSLPSPADCAETGFESAVLALFLLRNLQLTAFIPDATKDMSSKLEKDVFSLLFSAVQIARCHAREIKLLDVKSEKAKILETDIVTDVCGYGIYPELYPLENSGSGPENHTISWFVEKKLVFSSYRKVEPETNFNICSNGVTEKRKTADDMITFRCENQLCTNAFPLKENTKEKIIACPLDDCGIRTNIWEKLKLIQRLKKDFAEAKDELKKGSVATAKMILRDTIEEWDRILIRPYKEVDQLEQALVKAMICDIGDHERKVVEGNEMGHIIGTKKQNILPTEEEKEKETK